MKSNFICLFCFLFLGLGFSANGFAQSYSTGVYRLPVANGTQVNVLSDHTNSSPYRGQVSLGAANSTNSFDVAAAASGTIFEMPELTLTYCNDSVILPGEDCKKKLVMVHPNGEVSFYENLEGGSASALGWEVGDYVREGQIIGRAAPNGPNNQRNITFHVFGSMIVGGLDSFPPFSTLAQSASDRSGATWQYLPLDVVPVFCLGTSQGAVWTGQTWTAGNCMAMRMAPNSDQAIKSVSVYPNPANAEVNFRFEQATSGSVTLMITDIQGRIIQTPIQNAEMEAGIHEIKTNTSDLPAGVWFYQLHTSSGTETGKMMITR